MASVRLLKKEINKEVAGFIDDCYEYIITRPGNDNGAEALVDRAVELYDEVLDGVNEAVKQQNPGSQLKKLRANLFDKLTDLKIELAKKTK